MQSFMLTNALLLRHEPWIYPPLQHLHPVLNAYRFLRQAIEPEQPSFAVNFSPRHQVTAARTYQPSSISPYHVAKLREEYNAAEQRVNYLKGKLSKPKVRLVL